MSLLAALAAIPKIAASLETLATAVGQLNQHLKRVDAAKRRERKDDEVDDAITRILAADGGGVRDDEAGE